jgi:hypothetical protein
MPSRLLSQRLRLEALEDRSAPAVLTVNPANPTAFHTIGAAITAAHPGDTVMVDLAIYNENVLINKSLSLIGVSNGTTDPQIVGTGANNGMESVVHIADNTNNVLVQGFGISSPHGLNAVEVGVLVGSGDSNITIRGGIIRHLRDQTHPIIGASQTDAIVVSPKAHNVLITGVTIYNIVYDTTAVDVSKQFAYGILLSSNTATDGPNQVLIQHNYVSKVGDIGIAIMNGSHDVIADYNTVDNIFGSHVSYGILVSGALASPTNLLIHNNTVRLMMGKQPVGIAVLGATVGVQLVDNTVSGLTAGVGLQVSGGAHVTGDENTFMGNAIGVLVSQNFSGSLTLHYNNIDGNTTAGIENNSTQSVDTEANWWGSVTGPTNSSNPPGTGDKVIGLVDFTNWLMFAIST